GPDLDRFQPADQPIALAAVLHQFDLDYDPVVSLALYGELRIDRAGKHRMTARTPLILPAMMDKDDRAAKGVADCIGRPDVRGHVGIAGFRTVERTGERIKHHCHRNPCPKVSLDGLN